MNRKDGTLDQFTGSNNREKPIGGTRERNIMMSLTCNITALTRTIFAATRATRNTRVYRSKGRETSCRTWRLSRDRETDRTNTQTVPQKRSCWNQYTTHAHERDDGDSFQRRSGGMCESQDHGQFTRQERGNTRAVNGGTC